MHAIEEKSAIAQPEVEIKKAPRELYAKGGGEFIMHFKNFQPGEQITMTCAHVIQKNPGEFQEVEKFKMAEGGQLWIKETLVAFYTFGAKGIAKGERVKYRYALTDGTVVAESSFIPYPLVVHSKKKTFSIDIELLQLEPMVYLLSYHGLNNGERMRLMSRSGNEMDEEDFFLSYRTIEYLCAWRAWSIRRLCFIGHHALGRGFIKGPGALGIGSFKACS
jgi:hypothetical protein